VVNLATGEERLYTLSPREAVIAAYAQGTKGDWNSFDYKRKYGKFVSPFTGALITTKVYEGRVSVAVGDWCALKEKEKEVTR
jgi:hypothetical protein